ncbi:hypothetical protein GLOTRDRAFT_120992 [Gloeophyllum trabeum ATCC 11539]|uniref:Uncharacterized protein n=1 Tax=Gloeophyllum trabeum (strain ATCC 11539 / FP-39264 / Madison 617) TaxID=670483 RepID=S7RPR7_GLOTA|nr:uncharacterized protein GLOTRDRAFT_120992 [Gloeophyllum trabeum ATCC 11539]EPQ56560.1 hypothetical protein GLOTRDRAFT_120992 [Gloeophyllum trabeum ATCC 11539]
MEFPTYPASMSTFDDSAFFSPDVLPRRGNLHASIRTYSCPESDEQSVFYFGLQSPRETKDEFSSFLYLDLADAGSSRQTSLRGKASGSRSQPRKSMSDTRTSFLVVTSADADDFTADMRTPSPDFTDLLSATLRFDDPDSYTPMPRSPATPTTPSARRRSRDHLPSPKPAPSSLLPPVPPRTTHLQSLTLPTSPVSYALPSSPPVSHRASHSAPSVLSSFLPSPRTPRNRLNGRESRRRESRASGLTRGSSITSHQRRANRNNALAALEGRSRSPHRISRGRENFMSMSDDEDDDADADDEKENDCDLEEEEEARLDDFVQEQETRPRDSIHLHDAMLIEDEDVVIPLSPSACMNGSRPRAHSRVPLPPMPITATLAPAVKARSRANTLLLSVNVGATKPATPISTPPPSARRLSRRTRSMTLESWFPPLANFIDLADDASAEVGRWRSFIDVASP